MIYLKDSLESKMKLSGDRVRHLQVQLAAHAETLGEVDAKVESAEQEISKMHSRLGFII